MNDQTMQFQAEVSKLLNIVANSLYSEKEIFLRELISNASDACDKLRYAALTNTELVAGDPDFRITVTVDKKAGTITVADNGIGMNRDDLVENLGTIARSGTSAFLDRLSGDAAEDISLIGQFGVGFYSSLMIADRVEVLSRRAGEEQAWKWVTDGGGEFTVGEAERPGRGTTVTLHVRKADREFLDADRLKRVVTTYSDHIAIPIVFGAGSGDGAEGETVNRASALWTRPKNEITAEQYKEFYHHVAHAFDDPWVTIHSRAEGRLSYTLLLFVPSVPPMDLFHPDRKHQVKLYLKRVFVTDDCEDLVPAYLRFVRGIVDSEDLPLNISREMLQNNPLLAKIRRAVVKKVLGELERRADKAPDDYAAFWGNFGAVLKEGIYEDADNRERLLKLARFRSTHGDGLVSLADYASRMKEGQDAIYYISGDSLEALRRSPQIEGFAARGVEVLLLTDPVDDFWIGAVGEHDGKPLRSVTRGGADLEKIEPEKKSATPADEEASDSELATLIAAFKQHLGEAVKDVRASGRLTGSAVCLVAADGDMDLHLERLLKAHGQLKASSPRVLEINPRHDLVRALVKSVKEKGADAVADAAHLLLDQARVVEGEPLPDPAAFSRRLAAVMARGV